MHLFSQCVLKGSYKPLRFLSKRHQGVMVDNVLILLNQFFVLLLVLLSFVSFHACFIARPISTVLMVTWKFYLFVVCYLLLIIVLCSVTYYHEGVKIYLFLYFQLLFSFFCKIPKFQFDCSS